MAPPLDDNIRIKTDAKADFGNCLVFFESYKGQFLNTSNGLFYEHNDNNGLWWILKWRDVARSAVAGCYLQPLLCLHKAPQEEFCLLQPTFPLAALLET